MKGNWQLKFPPFSNNVFRQDPRGLVWCDFIIKLFILSLLRALTEYDFDSSRYKFHDVENQLKVRIHVSFNFGVLKGE